MSWTGTTVGDLGFSLKPPKKLRKVIKNVTTAVKKTLPIAAAVLPFVPVVGSVASRFAAGKTAAKVKGVATKVQKVRKTVKRASAAAQKAGAPAQVVTSKPADQPSTSAPETVVATGPAGPTPSANSGGGGASSSDDGSDSGDGAVQTSAPGGMPGWVLPAAAAGIGLIALMAMGGKRKAA